MKHYRRDRYQRGKVEYMVERAYEEFLFQECNVQTNYVAKLKRQAKQNVEQHDTLMQQAEAFELTRCQELDDLFPHARRKQQQQRKKYRSF